MTLLSEYSALDLLSDFSRVNLLHVPTSWSPVIDGVHLHHEKLRNVLKKIHRRNMTTVVACNL